MVTSCATVQPDLPKKYDFDKELEKATEIHSFRIKSWESIDYQSLIIRANVSDYYLLVLNRPARSLSFAENIGITLTVDKAKPGFDNIVVADSAGTEEYIIKKIYKFKDREQAKEIKNRLKKTGL